MPTRIKRYEERLSRLDVLLARIEAEMGPDAEIERHDFTRGRFLGLFGGERMVEIIATLEVNGGNGHTVVRPVDAAAQIPAPFAMPEEPLEHNGNGHAKAAPVIESTPAPEPAAYPVAERRQHVDIRAEDPMDEEMMEFMAAEARNEPRLDHPLDQNWRDAAPFEPPAPQPQRAAAAEPLHYTTTPPPSAIPEAVVPAPVQEPALPPVLPVDVVPVPTMLVAAAERSEILELKQSISELQETMRMLIEQQRANSAQPAATPQAPQGAEELSLLAGGAAAGDAAVGGADDEQSPDILAEAKSVLSVADMLAVDHATGLGGVERSVYDRLLEWNIGPYDSMELINTALIDLAQQSIKPVFDDVMQAIMRDICRNILLSGAIKLRKNPPGKVVALVGATGVGKTTTIAKLAAHYAFNEGKRVSLVSLDNYRIAAAEQLRTYTDIMGIDLDIVFSREEFDQVLTERSHNDLVLIDTAGRSPLNNKQIYELKEIFGAHPPDEVHLIIAAPTKADDMKLILENFAPLGYDHIIVSKLDETRSLGCIYNINKYAAQAGGRGLPISYFTVGQSVPEDIRVAQPEFIQTWIEQGRIT
jgi:flagellar biosynthesis GTPase FlhF